MVLLRIFLVCCSMFAGYANADLVGTWSIANSQTIKISYKDDNHIRMDVGNGTYMLIAGDKAYSVLNQGGQLMAMDLAAMSGMMKTFGGNVKQQVEANIKKYDPASVKFSKTGRSEQVAGFQGEVYQVTIDGPSGPEKAEFVASNDPDVIAFQNAFITMSGRMMKVLSSQKAVGSFNQAATLIAKNKMGGLLRYGKEMTLVGLKNTPVDSAAYELPKNAVLMSIPGLGN